MSAKTPEHYVRRIMRAFARVPDMRFGQFIFNASTMPHEVLGDRKIDMLFYAADQRLCHDCEAYADFINKEEVL